MQEALAQWTNVREIVGPGAVFVYMNEVGGKGKCIYAELWKDIGVYKERRERGRLDFWHLGEKTCGYGTLFCSFFVILAPSFLHHGSSDDGEAVREVLSTRELSLTWVR